MFDAAALGGMADGTLLVVRSGATAREAVEQAADDLHRARARLIGVVLTDDPNALKGPTYHRPNTPDSGAT